MMPLLKRYASLLMAAVLVGLAIHFFDVGASLKTIAQLSPFQVGLSILLAFAIYAVSGVQYGVVLRSQGIRMSASDTFIFPITMNLWSLLIPFQGAVVFATVFFARKYGRKVSGSLSITLFLYMITISLTGLLGLAFAYSTGRTDFLTVLVLSGISLSPVAIPMVDVALRMLLPAKVKVHPRLSKLANFFFDLTGSLRTLMRNPMLLLQVGALKLVKTAAVGLWYWVISKGLGIELSMVVLMLLSLVAELAIIVKVTPDNLGVNQLLSGALLAAMDFNPQWGVLISLVASATTLVLIFTVGVYGNYRFMRGLRISSMRELFTETVPHADDSNG